MSSTPTGELVIAGGGGDLVLVSVGADSTKADGIGGDPPQAAVTAFLEETSEVPDGGDLWTHLVTTDGDRTWEPDDLATVTTASPSDPTWLQLQAAVNRRRCHTGAPLTLRGTAHCPADRADWMFGRAEGMRT